MNDDVLYYRDDNGEYRVAPKMSLNVGGKIKTAGEKIIVEIEKGANDGE